jgi:amino acid transporter
MAQDVRAAAPPHEKFDNLKKNSIGVSGIIFMVVSATAPLTILALNAPLGIAFHGTGILGALLVVAIALAFFAVGFVLLSRHIVNAGAYYAFISRGLGRTVGTAAAVVAALAYNGAVVAIGSVAGHFVGVAADRYFGLSIPWFVGTALVLIGTSIVSQRGVSVAATVSTVFCVAQFAMVAALFVAVLVGNPGGFATDGFGTDAVLNGGNLGFAITFAFLCFAGFEATAIYGEEAKMARKSVAKATYGSLALLAVVFVVSHWTLIAAFDDAVGESQTDPGGMFVNASDAYLGSWSGALVTGLIAAAFIGATVSFHNMAARYMMALGRARVLPVWMSRTDPVHCTPHVASRAQVVFALLVLTPFALAGSDPMLVIVPIVGGFNGLALILLMVTCSVSVVVAARRGKIEGSTWATLVAPIVAIVFFGGVTAYVALNFASVAGSDAWYVNLAPVVLVAGIVFGIVSHLRIRRQQAGTEVELDVA